jgi:hypothetical protein
MVHMRFMKELRDCKKRVRPSSVKLTWKQSDIHHIYSLAPLATRKQKREREREEMSVPKNDSYHKQPNEAPKRNSLHYFSVYDK